MRFVLISDTHNQHYKLSMAQGDVLIVAGDFTCHGGPREIKNFARWLDVQPYKYKIVIAGNHDMWFEGRTSFVARELLYKYSSCIYLQDEVFDLEGLKVYGTPWQPRYNEWAFNLDRNSPELAAKWAAIPDDTDILITHGPPFGKLDVVRGGHRHGCEILAERLKEIQPKLHVFGHIHTGYGVVQSPVTGTISVNASICGEGNSWLGKAPIVVDL